MPSNYSTNRNIQSEVFTPTWIWHPSWERIQQSNALFPKDLQCRWRSKRHTHLQHLHSHLVTSNMPKVKAASQLSNAIAVIFQKFFSTSVTPNSNLVDVISLHNAQKVSFTYYAATKKACCTISCVPAKESHSHGTCLWNEHSWVSKSQQPYQLLSSKLTLSPPKLG